jgi:post-segregation antitoxin (ccd killing protein)
LLCVNLSATFEGALEAAVKVARLARWQEENREAFAADDKRIESTGVFGAGKRRFSGKKEVGRDGEYGNL